MEKAFGGKTIVLEIRDLVKIYRTKGGESVRALDGVSARFEETGMVFLLGKSGSGKSTLLNLCGGLDTPDEGEIIIRGRSSKNFTASDFDSYRNTCVGFIFQEYNILEEFSVEDNIASALELQGKNKDRARVQEILKEVDLAEYAKRKPNTLSGGQRQRVAIARALVKNPQIIMADEPTGALDSATGKQVLETLKKLSESKLVLVVSHDREFALTYGDRIIELCDGKIVSDVSKRKIGGDKTDGNLRFLDENTISIRSGARLTPDDMQKINDFLAATPEDVVITSGKEEIAGMRKAARIDEEGAKETFERTNEQAIAAKVYEPQPFLPSRLPMRQAVRIGASSMRVKPFRLIFTILLSFIALTLFGLSSTLMFFDRAQSSLRTYRDLGYETLTLENNFRRDVTSYLDGEEQAHWTEDNVTDFTPGDLDAMRAQYGESVLGVYDYFRGSFGLANVGNGRARPISYFSNRFIEGFAQVDAGDTFWEERLLTDTDLSELGTDGIIISSHMFDCMCYHGLFDDSPYYGQAYELNDHDDVVGKPLKLNAEDGERVTLTIRGVFRADLPAEYEPLKD